MLPRHTVTRFLKKSSSGRNGTCIVYCENEEGDETEFILKLTASECGISGLVCEIIASQFARDLDLRTPEPALLEITDDFAKIVPDSTVIDAMKRSTGWNFGTLKLPGQESVPPSFISVLPTRSLPPEWRQSAGEIYTFDGIVENPDRRQTNPNCLQNRNELVMIDHDMAFSFVAGVLFWKPVWNGGDLSVLREHLFHQHLRTQSLNLERFLGALEAIPERRFGEYVLSVPEEWDGGREIADKILNYLVDLKRNIIPALESIKNTLR
jgi:hypothetical protein